MSTKFHAKNLKEKAKTNFEEVWKESSDELEHKGKNISYGKKQGKTHPVVDTMYKFREIFLNLGFDEYINPAIVEDEEVYRQYGPEASLILDRVFYLASIPRDDIGIDNKKLKKIRKLIPEFEQIEKLKKLLRRFKKGKIEGDDFIEELAQELKIDESKATQIIEKIFKEFSELEAVTTNLTLRSHMTANWFSVLARKQFDSLPLKLFSIGSRFRKEQRQDKSHLFESTSASIVIMNSNLSMEDGEILTKKILDKLGLSNIRTVTKETTSKYYAYGFDKEVYARYKGEEFEIANFGFYSPVSLANYKIRFPVLNLGFGVERIAMILSGVSDIRKLVYPQFY